MALDKVINEFRRQHGRDEVVVHGSYNCEQHCWAMINANCVYHAEPCYLRGWSEAVARCRYMGDWGALERYLIFEILGKSQEHCDIMLNSHELNYGIVMYGNAGDVYLTLRGR